MQLLVAQLDCYVRLAFCHYLLNNLDKAKFYTEELNKIKPNTPPYFLNKAFFSILENNHQNIIEYYDNLKNKKLEPDFINDIILFLKNQKKIISNIGLDYGISILTYNFIDKTEGRKLLINFSSSTNVLVYKNKINQIINSNYKATIVHNQKSKKKKKSKRK